MRLSTPHYQVNTPMGTRMDASMFATCTLQTHEIDNCVGQKLGKTQALCCTQLFTGHMMVTDICLIYKKP